MATAMRALLARLTGWATIGPAWPLGTFLLVALVLRLPAVLCADGYEFLDQQFQYVDPAWHLATGQAWLPTWEWQDGIRSWVYPGFLAGLFRVLLACGLDDPLWLMRGVRGVHAVLSLLPLAMFWLCLVRWRLVEAPRLPLLLFAGSGLLVALGVQPSGLAWGGTLAIAAVLAFHGPGRWPLLAGLLLGFGFCGRFQDALYGPALVAVAVFQRRWRAIGWLGLGCLPGLVLQGYSDLVAWGRFFHSPLAYLAANGDGGAAKWGREPWWFYAACVAPIVLLVPPFLGEAWRRLRLGAGLLPGAAVAAGLHLFAHSLIERKALRFEYASLALLVAVVAAGLGVAPATGRWANAYRRGLVAVQGLLWVWASCLFGHSGAISAALALRNDPHFRGDLVVVDGSSTAVGGAYYLRQERLRVHEVERARLPALLAQVSEGQPLYLLVVRRELQANELGGHGPLLQLGNFCGWLDLRTSDRRFLYRYVGT